MLVFYGRTNDRNRHAWCTNIYWAEWMAWACAVVFLLLPFLDHLQYAGQCDVTNGG